MPKKAKKTVALNEDTNLNFFKRNLHFSDILSTGGVSL